MLELRLTLVPDAHRPYTLAYDEIQDPIIGEEGVPYVATPRLSLWSVWITLGESTKAHKCRLKHREPSLGVPRPDLALFFEFPQPGDMLLDISVQSRGMEDGEVPQRAATPSPRRSRKAGSASSMGRPSPRSISAYASSSAINVSTSSRRSRRTRFSSTSLRASSASRS